MSNAHVNHKHGVTQTPTLRPKSSNAKKRNKALARVRKAVVLANVAAKKAELKK
jgi:hypothetical protein